MIGAMWCPSCLVMRSRLRKLVGKYPGVILEEHDYDTDKEAVSLYVRDAILPVTLFMHDEVEVARMIGEQPISVIERAIGDHRC